MPLHFSSTPRLLREAAPCIPKPPATQTISHACQTASNSITDHATNMSCIISMLLLLHLIHPSPNSSPPPPPAPLIPLPQTPQNSHLTQPLQHNETAHNSGTDAGKQGNSYQKQAKALPACGRGLVGSQSPPLVAPRGQKWHSSFACDTHSAKVSERSSDSGISGRELGSQGSKRRRHLTLRASAR